MKRKRKVLISTKTTWKLCASDAALISDSEAFGLEKKHLNICDIPIFCLMCIWDLDWKEALESSPKYLHLKPFILLDPHRRFNRIEPVKKNDGEEHPSLEVGNVGGKIHVAAGTQMNKTQCGKSLNSRWQVMEKNWSPDENNPVNTQLNKCWQKKHLMRTIREPSRCKSANLWKRDYCCC